MKSFLRFLAFCFFFAVAQPVGYADSCSIVLPDTMTLQSSFNGNCNAGLAHGYGKVVVGKMTPKTGRKLLVTYEGMFQSGYLTGAGKETEESGLYWYEGTFNNWKRWTGTAHIAQTAQDRAREMYFREGAITSSPVDVTQDPLYYAKAEKTARGQSSSQPRFLSFSGNTESSSDGGGDYSGNSSTSESGGLANVPIVGALFRGATGGVKEQAPRIAQALREAPNTYVRQKLVEEKDRRERRKLEEEERKKQEVIAKQEQENATYWAKRDQEARDIRARAEEEDRKRRAKYEEERSRQEQERLANLAKQDQAAREVRARADEEQKKQRTKQEEEWKRQEQERAAYSAKQDQIAREARARADEERKQRESQARSNTANPVSPPIVSTQPATAPTNRQTPPKPPQVATQQPTNGSALPSLGTNSPSLPTQNSFNQQVGQSNAIRKPDNNAPLQQASSATKLNQTKSPVTPSVGHQQATPTYSNQQAPSPTYQQVLTPAEIAWMNSLPPDDATRKLPPSTIARMKREGKWVGYVAGTNNANQSIAQDKKEQAQYEQRAEKILKTAETAGEVAQGALLITPGGGLVGAGGKVVAKVIEKKVEKKVAETATTRGVDAASTGGINKVAPSSGKTSVYQSVDSGGKVKYVGISDNLSARASAHLNQKGIAIDEIPGLKNISREDARAVEQVLIEYHGLGKNGGTLVNKINSIAKTNPNYAQALNRGYSLLHSVGYPGF